jgi:hypothetical protein
MATRTFTNITVISGKDVERLEAAIDKSTPVEATLHEVPQYKRATKEEMLGFLMGNKK